MPSLSAYSNDFVKLLPCDKLYWTKPRKLGCLFSSANEDIMLAFYLEVYTFDCLCGDGVTTGYISWVREILIDYAQTPKFRGGLCPRCTVCKKVDNHFIVPKHTIRKSSHRGEPTMTTGNSAKGGSLAWFIGCRCLQSAIPVLLLPVPQAAAN